MPEKKSPWPQVILVLGALLILVTGAVILLALGKSEAAILTLAALVAVPALTWYAGNTNQKLEQVKELSNGNLTKRDQTVDAQMQQMMKLTEQLLSLVAQTHPAIPAEVAERMMPPHLPSAPSSPAPMPPPEATAALPRYDYP